MPEEKQIIEAAAEVVETGLAPAGELAVTYLPAQIKKIHVLKENYF